MDEQKRLSDADGGAHDLRRAEIEEKREEAVTIKKRYRERVEELPTLEDSRNRASRECEDLYVEVKAKRVNVQQCTERLKSLERDRGQQQQAYPPTMPRLLNAIRQDDGFEQKPIGPLGTHVRLLKPLWSSILEKSFGGALNSFIVTSKQDQHRLSDLMQTTGW